MLTYKNLLAGVAVMTLATSVFAADEVTVAAASAPVVVKDNPAVQATETTTVTTTTDTDTVTTKININTATVKELAKLKGLTLAKAKAIVMHRKKHGDFKAVSELKSVKGFKKMKEATFNEVQAQLTIS